MPGVRILLILGLILSFARFGIADEPVTLLRTIEVPGNLIDKSKLTEPLGPGIWQDLFGGISALEYLGHDDLYLALADRGPLDGAVEWACRAHVVQIPMDRHSFDQAAFTIKKTILLRDGENLYSGAADRFEAAQQRATRLDPEGIRVGRKNNFYVSDEYGPQLLEFSFDGRLARHHKIPSRFLIANPGVSKKAENENNQTGRQSNRGMEGLAISADGKRLFGLMQSPLLQDCVRDESGKPTGQNCRLLELEIDSGKCREFLYPLEFPSHKLNEILTYDDQNFLVIERDGLVGQDAQYKKIIKTNLSHASDIQSIDSLPANQLPQDVTPVNKTVLIDLLDERFGLAGNRMPEKIESLALGPVLHDGRRTLLVVSDNDFKTGQPTLIYCFAIGECDEEKQLLTTR